MTEKKERRPPHRLSADLPQHWLHAPVYWSLSDRAWRLHTHAHMWAIGRTNGFIPQDVLSLLMPGADAEREAAAQELTSAGLWVAVTAGWEIPRWRETQSTPEEIQRNREGNRRRQQEWRDRQAETVTEDVTRYVTPNETAHVGKGRVGDTRTGSTTYSPVTNPSTNGENFLCAICKRGMSHAARAHSLRVNGGETICDPCTAEPVF
jgi:hypothetical protein